MYNEKSALLRRLLPTRGLFLFTLGPVFSRAGS